MPVLSPTIMATNNSNNSAANKASFSTNTNSNPPAASQALRRAPSLSEIAASIRSQNPEKWERIRKKSIAAVESNLASSAASSVPMGHSKSLDPASMTTTTTNSGAGLAAALQSISMSNSSSTASNVSATSATDSVASGSSSEAPRLRLTARLAAAAPAPLLSRSQSTNSIIDSNAASRHGSGAITDTPSFATSPTSGLALPGSSLPALSSLQTTLARRSSISNSPSQSLPSRGLPSLDAIKERFALKKEKEKEKEISTSVKDGKKENLAAISPANGSVKTQDASLTVKAKEIAASLDTGKENIDPKPGLDASRRPSIVLPEPASKPMSKTSSSTSSSASSASLPTTPTDSSMPLSQKGALKNDHPLEHKWTLYYDSRSTARAAAANKPATPTSVGHPNGVAPTTGKQAWEASLSTLASVSTVESFCRLYNWLKKPGKMGMNENLHFFKDDILPMWEDERNKNGGKWTICLDTKIMNVKELVDKLWMYLCFALIGEDFEEKNELICGAVVSTRPRMYRFQVWINNKEDLPSVNAIGKNLVRILELEHPTTGARIPGISLDFSYHSKPTPPPQKFLHIPATPVPAPSSAFQALPGAVNSQSNRTLTPSGSVSSISAMAGNRPSGFGMTMGSGGGIGLSRAVSMNAIASKLEQNSPSNNAPMNWRERLGQPSKKSSLAA